MTHLTARSAILRVKTIFDNLIATLPPEIIPSRQEAARLCLPVARPFATDPYSSSDITDHELQLQLLAEMRQSNLPLYRALLKRSTPQSHQHVTRPKAAGEAAVSPQGVHNVSDHQSILPAVPSTATTTPRSGRSPRRALSASSPSSSLRPPVAAACLPKYSSPALVKADDSYNGSSAAHQQYVPPIHFASSSHQPQPSAEVTNEPRIMFLSPVHVKAVEWTKEYLDVYYRVGHITEEEYPGIVMRVSKQLSERIEAMRKSSGGAPLASANTLELTMSDREWLASVVKVECAAFAVARSTTMPLCRAAAAPKAEVVQQRAGSPIEQHLQQLRQLASQTLSPPSNSALNPPPSRQQATLPVGASSEPPVLTVPVDMAVMTAALQNMSPLASARTQRRAELTHSIAALSSQIAHLNDELLQKVQELESM